MSSRKVPSDHMILQALEAQKQSRSAAHSKSVRAQQRLAAIETRENVALDLASPPSVSMTVNGLHREFHFTISAEAWAA